MNATFCIAAARCGWDDGHFELIGSSLIIDPEGHIMAESQTLDDELVVAEIDLDACLYAYAVSMPVSLNDSNLAHIPLADPARNAHFASRSTVDLKFTQQLRLRRELWNC